MNIVICLYILNILIVYPSSKKLEYAHHNLIFYVSPFVYANIQLICISWVVDKKQ